MKFRSSESGTYGAHISDWSHTHTHTLSLNGHFSFVSVACFFFVISGLVYNFLGGEWLGAMLLVFLVRQSFSVFLSLSLYVFPPMFHSRVVFLRPIRTVLCFHPYLVSVIFTGSPYI